MKHSHRSQKSLSYSGPRVVVFRRFCLIRIPLHGVLLEYGVVCHGIHYGPLEGTALGLSVSLCPFSSCSFTIVCSCADSMWTFHPPAGMKFGRVSKKCVAIAVCLFVVLMALPPSSCKKDALVELLESS